jgi:hypothetical protein
MQGDRIKNQAIANTFVEMAWLSGVGSNTSTKGAIAYIKKFEDIIKYNSLLPIEQFLVYALPLRDKILNRDESYFSNTDNHKDKIGNDEYSLNEILRLQKIYSELDVKSRSNVWDILQAMLCLGEDYIRLRTNTNVKKVA